MAECKNCGTAVPADAKFCPKCGVRLNVQKGKRWARAAVASVAVVIIIGCSLYWFSGREKLITKPPDLMVPTSAEMPGWEIGNGESYFSPSDWLVALYLEPAEIAEVNPAEWDFRMSYKVSFYKPEQGTTDFHVLSCLTIEGAKKAFADLKRVLSKGATKCYSPPIGDEAWGIYWTNGRREDGIIFRKANIVAIAGMVTGWWISEGSSLPYARMVESKIE